MVLVVLELFSVVVEALDWLVLERNLQEAKLWSLEYLYQPSLLGILIFVGAENSLPMIL